METQSRDRQHEAVELSDYTFEEEDVSGLAEALADVAHKWEEIAVMLRLPEVVRAECREGNSLNLKLFKVLNQWVVGQHLNTVQATRENLKSVLASPLVQRPQLACELDDKLKTSLSLHTGKKHSFVHDCGAVLAKRYSQSPEVPCGSWPPVVSKVYINLALIEARGQPLKPDYSIRGDVDDVLAEKEIVEYEQMFSIYDEEKKILILGRPGSGKTTLVHKIVRDWSAGKVLQGAELVFLISLRMLNSRNNCSLTAILQKYFFDKEKLKQVVNAIERVQGKRVTFILDGFDEYCPPNKEESVVLALLDKAYLVDAMVIVTSRPAAASAANEVFDNSYKKIEVFGFSKSQIMEYIENFPFTSSSVDTRSQCEKLQRYLEFHPGVLDLCYLPINCAIVSFIFDAEPDHPPDTQTQIYAIFTRLIIIRQLTRADRSKQLRSLEDLEGEEAEHFKKLSSLAFDMTKDSQQVIAQGPAISDEERSLGLVTIDITAGLCGYACVYSFLHLTLQEFLAAYHLSKLNEKEQLCLIEKYGGTHHMLNVWKFFFGLVNFDTGLNRAKNLFTRIDSCRQHVDCELFKVQCLYEAKQPSVCKLVPSKELSLRTRNNYDISALAYTMSMAATQAAPTTCLNIVAWGPGDDLVHALISQLNDRALGYLEEIRVDSYKFTFADTKAIAGKLNLSRFKQPDAQRVNCLKSLRLVGGNISDEKVAVLAAGLDGNHVLETLSLSHNQISATGILEIMKADCSLQQFFLGDNDIGDEGAKAVAKGLKSNPSLKKIDLSRNGISVVGVEALAVVLQGNYLSLNLFFNQFNSCHASFDAVTPESHSETGDRIMQDVKVDQLPHHCNLEYLDLSYNICGGDPVALISKFGSLCYLNLSNNKIDLSGAMAVMDYVANSDSCQHIKYLGLSNIDFFDVKNEIIQTLFQSHRGSAIGTDPLSSGFVIALTHNNIDKTKAVSLLQAMKNYDRVIGVDFDGTNINMDGETIAELEKAFRHDRIDRFLKFNRYLILAFCNTSN